MTKEIHTSTKIFATMRFNVTHDSFLASPESSKESKPDVILLTNI